MQDNDIDAARTVAFRFLSHSARSRAEMEKRLRERDFSEPIVEQVLGEMEGLGYLDDADFARRWVEDRADRKGYGKSRLQAELNRKGIDRDLSDEALDSLDDDAEFRRALTVARHRWDADELAELEPLGLIKVKQKISGFLLRRGFSWSTVKKVLSAIMENSS